MKRQIRPVLFLAAARFTPAVLLAAFCLAPYLSASRAATPSLLQVAASSRTLLVYEAGPARPGNTNRFRLAVTGDRIQ